MLLFRLRTICKTVDGKFFPTRLIAQTLPLLTIICSGRCRTTERPHWNTVHIRTGYQKLAWFILGHQAGAVLLGWNPQIARKMGKSHSFRWSILGIILLYMFFLNKRSNFEKKSHELSYRSNIMNINLLETWRRAAKIETFILGFSYNSFRMLFECFCCFPIGFVDSMLVCPNQ